MEPHRTIGFCAVRVVETSLDWKQAIYPEITQDHLMAGKSRLFVLSKGRLRIEPYAQSRDLCRTEISISIPTPHLSSDVIVLTELPSPKDA
jgi:hypothetical protein